METDQVEQIDVLLIQSTKLINKTCDTEETDASTTMKRDNRFLSSFDNKDTQTEIVMVENRNTSSIISGQQLEMTWMNKSIIEPQKISPVDLETLGYH